MCGCMGVGVLEGSIIEYTEGLILSRPLCQLSYYSVLQTLSYDC